MGKLYASRTISLKISSWAMLEEIIEHRGFKDLKEVMTYVIRSEYALIQAKRETKMDTMIGLRK